MGKLIVEFHIDIAGFHLGIGIGKVEIFNVPRTDLDGAVEVAFFANIHEIDVLTTHEVSGHATERVTLPIRLISFHVILQLHVRVKRVVFRNRDIL